MICSGENGYLAPALWLEPGFVLVPTSHNLRPSSNTSLKEGSALPKDPSEVFKEIDSTV